MPQTFLIKIGLPNSSLAFKLQPLRVDELVGPLFLIPLSPSLTVEGRGVCGCERGAYLDSLDDTPFDDSMSNFISSVPFFSNLPELVVLKALSLLGHP